MTEDAAVRAVKDARAAHSPAQDTSWNRHWCTCGEQFTSLAKYEDHRNAVAVEAARPIIEQEMVDKIASIAKPDTARWLTTVVRYLDFGPGDWRRGAVRTEPEDG